MMLLFHDLVLLEKNLTCSNSSFSALTLGGLQRPTCDSFRASVLSDISNSRSESKRCITP